jgi:HAMP domain-containing protein
MQLKIATAAKFAGLLLCGGFCALAVVRSYGMEELRIGGALYERVILGKDLIADILPPPAYVIEPYLELQMAHTEPARVSIHKAKFDQLVAQYQRRHDFWMSQPISEAARIAITDRAHRSVVAMVSTANDVFFPALQRQDFEAARNALATIHEHFEAHRAAIESAVRAASEWNASIEQEAAAANSWIKIILNTCNIFMLLVILTCVTLMLRGLVGPIVRLNDAMRKLAAGVHDVPVPSLQRKDELGDMARTLEVFRISLLDNVKLEAEARAARSASDDKSRKLHAMALEFLRDADEINQILDRQAHTMRRSARGLTTISSTTTGGAGQQMRPETCRRSPIQLSSSAPRSGKSRCRPRAQAKWFTPPQPRLKRPIRT